LREEDIILILPSYGFTSRLATEKGMSKNDIERMVSDKWIAAIRILSNKFPENRFVWKLHPASEKDQLWYKITSRIKKEYKEVTIISPKEIAEKWIIKSKVIVGDVSTIFWWANFLNSKILISLDIFNYSSGDGMKYYEGIYYFDSLNKLVSADFREAIYSRRLSKVKNRKNLLTLTSFLKEVRNKDLEY